MNKADLNANLVFDLYLSEVLTKFMVNELDWIIPWTALLASIGTLVTVIILLIQIRISIKSQNDAHESFENSRKAYEIDIFLRLSDQLKEQNMLLIAAGIAENSPILVENGGVSSEFDLVRYLSLFTDVLNYLQMKTLDPGNVYNHFGNYAIALSKNEEVRKYIERVQKTQDPHTWGAIDKLAGLMEKFVNKS